MKILLHRDVEKRTICGGKITPGYGENHSIVRKDSYPGVVDDIIYHGFFAEKGVQKNYSLEPKIPVPDGILL